MMATPATASDVVKDNYIPILSCRPTDYRDWRTRIMLYWKMELQKREQEATINLLTSLHGIAWNLVFVNACHLILQPRTF